LILTGATSIIATNWNLSDESAAFFMNSFYQSFLKGKTVSVSLYEARKAIYKNFTNPFHWGVYTLYGNPFKIFQSNQ